MRFFDEDRQANKRLRVELLKIYHQQLEIEIKSLYEEIETELDNIGLIEKQIIEEIRSSNISFSTKEALEDFFGSIEDLARNACNSVLEEKKKAGISPTSEQITWFNLEIRQYLKRVHVALAKSDCRVLRYEKFLHQSKLDSCYYSGALREVKRRIHTLGLIAKKELDRYLEYLIENL